MTEALSIGRNTEALPVPTTTYPLDRTVTRRVVHTKGAWISAHDCRNDYATPIPKGRYRVHRSVEHAPPVFWLERTGETTPRSAHALLRSRRRGWSLALYLPFAEFTEDRRGEESIEVAVCTAEPRPTAIEIYTAGRRLYPLTCPPDRKYAWWRLAHRTNGTIALKVEAEGDAR